MSRCDATPVCQERLELSSSGQVVLRFKRAWPNGAHAVVLAPLDFISRLVALIPKPHFNLTRYHGVFAARSKHRSEVVPGPAPKEASAEPVQLRLAFGGEQARATLADEVETKRASRHPWAYLLQRVFAVDVLTCSLCKGAMRLVKSASTVDEVARGLAALGLGPRPPPRARPKLPGQLELTLCA